VQLSGLGNESQGRESGLPLAYSFAIARSIKLKMTT
jgi:hypothetical protein